MVEISNNTSLKDMTDNRPHLLTVLHSSLKSKMANGLWSSLVLWEPAKLCGVIWSAINYDAYAVLTTLIVTQQCHFTWHIHVRRRWYMIKWLQQPSSRENARSQHIWQPVGAVRWRVRTARQTVGIAKQNTTLHKFDKRVTTTSNFIIKQTLFFKQMAGGTHVPVVKTHSQSATY